MNMPILRQMAPDVQGEGLLARLRAMYRRPVVYEVAENYRCFVTIAGRRELLLLPAGFRTDLASTPRISWALGFRPDSPALLLPGLWHDWYYRFGYYLGDGDRPLYRGRGRAFADREFAMQVCRRCGLFGPAIVARLALWVGGWPAWRVNEKWRKAPYRQALQGEYQD